jgi:hypothetical protein
MGTVMYIVQIRIESFCTEETGEGKGGREEKGEKKEERGMRREEPEEKKEENGKRRAEKGERKEERGE